MTHPGSIYLWTTCALFDPFHANCSACMQESRSVCFLQGFVLSPQKDDNFYVRTGNETHLKFTISLSIFYRLKLTHNFNTHNFTTHKEINNIQLPRSKLKPLLLPSFLVRSFGLIYTQKNKNIPAIQNSFIGCITYKCLE